MQHLRHYREAKAMLTNALGSKDCDEDLKPTIRKQIAECDTCILWDDMYKAAINKLIEIKKGTGQITQTQEAGYYIAIMTWLEKLNEVNPSEYYKNGIAFRNGTYRNFPHPRKQYISNRIVISV